MPLEDAWMGMEYPDSLQMPWAWGEYELRYINTPKEYKGLQPLWVNNNFLQNATYKDGELLCGDMKFNALLVDVEYLDSNSLETMIKLA